LLRDLKRQGYHIHLSVTGGRRMISLLAISVAALHFDRHDHIWHIYTPEEVIAYAKKQMLMHLPPDAGVKLINGPFISLGAYLDDGSASFQHSHQKQRSHVWELQRTRCEQVFTNASTGQRKVLQAYSQGLGTEQVADELHLSEATVHSHKRVLLQLCRNAWDIAVREPLTYHFLQTQFADYFDVDG
jgi:CRISPR-associated protein Csx14